MDTKYFMGEIDLPNGIRKDLITAKDINDAHDIIEHKIKMFHIEFDRYNLDREKSVWAPYRPIGSFLVRYATTQEILKDVLKDFAGNWNECSLEGMTEEILEIVLETIPRKAFEEELARREEEGEDN